MTNDEKREQVAKQCEVVAHMGAVLAEIGRVNAEIIRDGKLVGAIDIIGTWTAHLMEEIGDVLNNIDAVDDDDEKFAPVFKAAQKLFPREAR